MTAAISKAERLDLLIALSRLFERGEMGETTDAVTIVEKFAQTFAFDLSESDLSLWRERAVGLDNLSAENQQIWLNYWLEKIKRRGTSARLDSLIHPSQIVKFLKSEPKNVQTLIIRNLPTESQLQISAELKINSAQNVAGIVRDDVLEIIKKNFLGNFNAYEDIFEPQETDRFNYGEISDFVYLLGIRETAIACRGLKSKESLAVFLNRFDKRDAHEIARFITQLEKIKPFWVFQADRLIQNLWTNSVKPHDFLTALGLKLFALAYSDRDAAAQKFTEQKLSVADSEKWTDFLAQTLVEIETADEDERSAIDKRRGVIKRLAQKFDQTKNL